MIIYFKENTIPYIKRDGIVSQYFSEIRSYERLTFEEEVKLIKMAQSNDKSEKVYAIDKLVKHNQRFIISAARTYSNNDNFMDLVNEGNIGLIKAIENFDITKKVKFITYAAWWIKKSMTDYLAYKSELVTPANAILLKTATKKIRQEFYTKNQRNPTLEEVQSILREKYDFNVKNLSDLEVYQSLSIDYRNDNEDDDTFSESLEFNNATANNNITKDIEEYDMKTLVNNLLQTLNPQEQIIIKKAFGIDCIEETFDTIGCELNLSKERIRQKVQEIIKKLNKRFDKKVV